MGAEGESNYQLIYLEMPGRILELLPRNPDPGRKWDGWSFGYSGNGPTALAKAICRTLRLVDGVEVEGTLYKWIYQQVAESATDELRIPVADIRARYHRVGPDR